VALNYFSSGTTYLLNAYFALTTIWKFDMTNRNKDTLVKPIKQYNLRGRSLGVTEVSDLLRVPLGWPEVA
jgi:hypothetical protein